MWALVRFAPLVIPNRWSFGLLLGRSASSLIASAHGHSLMQDCFPQHANVLSVPFADWSVLDFRILRPTLCFSKSTSTSFILSSVTSHALSIQANASAYIHAGLVYDPFMVHFSSHVLSLMSLIWSSLARTSGPRCLLSAFLHKKSCLSSGADQSCPASMCINLSSCTYWSPDCSCASSSAVEMASITSWFTGKWFSPQVALRRSMIFLLFAFFAKSVALARNFFRKVSFAFFRSLGAFANFNASFMPCLDLSCLWGFPWLFPSSFPELTCSGPVVWASSFPSGGLLPLLTSTLLRSLWTTPPVVVGFSLALSLASWLLASLFLLCLASSLLTATKWPVLSRLLAWKSWISSLLVSPPWNCTSLSQATFPGLSQATSLSICRPPIDSCGIAAAHIVCRIDIPEWTPGWVKLPTPSPRGTWSRRSPSAPRLRPIATVAQQTSVCLSRLSLPDRPIAWATAPIGDLKSTCWSCTWEITRPILFWVHRFFPQQKFKAATVKNKLPATSNLKPCNLTWYLAPASFFKPSQRVSKIVKHRHVMWRQSLPRVKFVPRRW